jgi:ABC-2 type transport system permease protein
MSGTIFAETLRRNWRTELVWGLGIGLLGYFIVVLIGDASFLENMTAVLNSLPPSVLEVFGASSVSSFTSSEGFVSAVFFTYAGLIMAIYALLSGMNLSANEEESGILDLVLSLPVGRLQLMLERYAAYVLMTVGMALLIYMGLFLGSLQTGLKIDKGLLLAGVVNMLPITLFMMAFTAAVAVIVHRRGTALGIAAAYLIVAYFLNFLASAVTHVIVQTASYVSMFTFYDSQTVLQQGLVIGNILVLVIALLVFGAAALYFFKRRDIAV